jgi:hypothetical protein
VEYFCDLLKSSDCVFWKNLRAPRSFKAECSVKHNVSSHDWDSILCEYFGHFEVKHSVESLGPRVMVL